MSARVARAVVVRLLRRLRGGQLTVVAPDGQTFRFGEPSSLATTVVVRDPRTWRAWLRGSYGMAASYADGMWECDDLVVLTRIAARNVAALDRLRARLAPVRLPVQRLTRRVHAPTIRRSRRQIAAHYDLGNDLFATFLDETMMYSAAYFPTPEATLLEASRAKLDRVCHKLELAPEDHLLEIGTGWGGLAVHAAGRYGCRVTTTTISREQYDLAVERVREAGLEDLVTVLLEDYRNLTGSYDKLVSIEMIEAVGWRYFDTYFRRCAQLLKADGAMLLQAITIDHSAYEVEKDGRSFMKDLIFPGGCLPSLEVIRRCVTRTGALRTVEVEDITPHYVRTLRCWRERFEAATARLEELGYDHRFRRLWRMYLCYSEAGFAERRIQDVHVLISKAARPRPRRAARPPREDDFALGTGRAA
ncbi:MAG TPA: cyclopropane-fatty-acyl-phospholipid synthase family protein [Solirubrobacteraceae bacterium]|jgi:cyclopropane-fatty-acyl-phospholipid synthase|nr:cyclopropane-fatty-acyl-phospholipid synthase family protein [Solirubrobacteraceae bacterium]